MGIGKTKSEKRRALRAAVTRVATVLAIGVLIVSAMYCYDFLTTSERFAITEVVFDGLDRIEGDDLEKIVHDLVGENILLSPLDAYEERLEALPRVESAGLRRILPGRVSCTIVERQPVALVFTDRFLEVDAAGMVMVDDDYSSKLDLPIITGVAAGDVTPGRISGSPGLARALNALSLCKSFGGDFASDISELRVDGAGISIRSLTKDFVIVLGEADYEKRLRKYFLLKGSLAEREQNARLIDLRFEDQVVVRGHI